MPSSLFQSFWPKGPYLCMSTMCVSRCDSQEPALSPVPASYSELLEGRRPCAWHWVTRRKKSCSCPKEGTVVLIPGGKARDATILLSFPSSCEPGDPLSPFVTSNLCFRTPAMKTVYCMNKAEIMDVALGILIEVKSAVSLSALMIRDFMDRNQSKVFGHCQGFCFC